MKAIIEGMAAAFSSKVAIYILAAGMAAVATYTVYLKLALSASITKVATQESEFNRKLLKMAEAGLAESERARYLEEQMNELTQRNQAAFLAEQQRNKLALAELVRDRSRVRDSIRIVATGSDQTPSLAAATCSARAASLGDGLESSLRTEEDLSSELESAWSSTRALLEDSRIVRQRAAAVRSGQNTASIRH